MERGRRCAALQRCVRDDGDVVYRYHDYSYSSTATALLTDVAAVVPLPGPLISGAVKLVLKPGRVARDC